MTRTTVRWFAIVLAIQVLILAGMSLGRETTLLADDNDVKLQTIPVDPRDLLRGDFVILRYEISSLPIQNADIGDTVYVELIESTGGHWGARSAGISIDPDWDRFIRGTKVGTSRIEYDIEAYFIPEGRGFEIERATDVDVIASIDNNGRAVIKEVLIDGEAWAR